MKCISGVTLIISPGVMSGRVTDDGLSEVIGFILIIAIIVILGSLYMTYVVPSQGRDAEIQHMQNVEKFFTDFKLNMDSLWFNNQEGVSFNQQLSLGTGGQTSAGAFSIFPIMQPVSSSGKVSINSQPTINFTIGGYFLNATNSSISETDEDYLAIYANYSTNIHYTDTPPYDPHTLTIWPEHSDIFRLKNAWELVNWVAILEVKNATLRQDDLYHVLNWTEHPETREVSHLEIVNYPVKEVTITVIKDGVKTLEDEVIYRGLISEYTWNETIRVNLMEEAYGLSNERIIRSDLSYRYTNSAGVPETKYPSDIFEFITTDGNRSNESSLDILNTSVTSKDIPIGTFNYSSKNPYWINQDYLYQFGEVELKQGDIIQPKISSNWIQVSDGPGSTKNVDINLISIYGDSTVGGQDEVQITSTIRSIRNNLIEGTNGWWYKLKDSLIKNVHSFEMSITASNNKEARYWYDSINKTLSNGGLVNTYPSPTGNVASFTVENDDIHLRIKHVLIEMRVDSRVYG